MNMNALTPLLIAICALTATHADAQKKSSSTSDEDKSNPQEIKENDLRSYWKKKHEKRIKTNQIVALQLQQTRKLKSIPVMTDSLISASKKLPINGRHATRIRNIISDLREAESSADPETQSRQVESARREIADISEQLAFEPKLETDLPHQYAAPTPVGEVEIKYYPPTRAAETNLAGSPMRGQGTEAFFRLFNHIQKNKIKMTSPVEMIYERTDQGLNESTMRFLYAHQAVGETNGEGPVKVIDTPALSVIAIGIRGRCDKKCIADAAERLREHSLKYLSAFKLSNEVRVLGYNGPSVPEKDQFFEVQIKLIKITKPLKKRI